MACSLIRIQNTDSFCDYQIKTNDAMTAIEANCDALDLITSGSYEPTFTSNSGFSNVSLNKAYYQRIGSIVTVHGKFSCDYSGSGDAVIYHLTLPIASTFTDEFDLNGLQNTNSGTDAISSLSAVALGQVGGGLANTARFFGTESNTSQTSLVVCYSFSYIIK